MITTIGYKNLVAWQKADYLAQIVYSKTNHFPKSEIYGITSQIRRASLSIPTNIVEGYARNSKPEFRRFISIALGSLAETQYLCDFAFSQKYITKEDYQMICAIREETGTVLWGLYKSLS